MSLYRIPIAIEGDGLAWIDELDLAFLLDHSGGGIPDLASLIAQTAAGANVPVQWLPRPEPSVVAGQRRGTLLIGAPRRAGKDPVRLSLLVQTGKGGPGKKPEGKD